MVKLNLYQHPKQKGTKFIRRKDLTVEIRLYISFLALMDNSWGIISRLAKNYAISRTFVYMLQSQLNKAIEKDFYIESIPSKNEIMIESKTKSLGFALLLRMEGKSSIASISDIMKRLELRNNSVGTISQTLDKIGEYLPNTLEFDKNTDLYVYLASDEVFSHSSPILISVDPISTTILKIELAESRKTEVWINHFKALKENGVNIIRLVSDEGPGICKANDLVFKETCRQPDTFHAISHRLGKWVSSLEKSAYASIGEEYHYLEVFESAKTEEVLQKRMDAYFEAKRKTDEAIMLYENYKFLYHCIINQLQVFDKEGIPRNRKNAEENIRIALDYMISLPINKINKEINTIYNLLDELLGYLDVAEQIIKHLKFKKIPHYILREFSLAWQYQKNTIKAKNTIRRKYYQDREQEQLELLEMILGNKFESIKTTVFFELDKIVQSSAIVENINSIIRTFLNTSKNHINQNMLNLIMFYHNHRRYKAGKRKGKTPLELLTGIKQDKDWLELLLEKEEVQREFLQAA